MKRVIDICMTVLLLLLMGIHLGLHMPVMTAKMKTEDKTRTAVTALFSIIAGRVSIC